MSQQGSAASQALLFGHEEGLLSTRMWLLNTTGCNCLAVSTLSTCKEALLDRPYDLLVLCQTVSADDCTAAAQFADQYCAKTALLVMLNRHTRCSPEQDYVLLEAAAGPEAFIRTVSRMLTRSAK